MLEAKNVQLSGQRVATVPCLCLAGGLFVFAVALLDLLGFFSPTSGSGAPARGGVEVEQLSALLPTDLDSLWPEPAIGRGHFLNAVGAQLLLFAGQQPGYWPECQPLGAEPAELQLCWRNGSTAPLSLLDRHELIKPTWKGGGPGPGVVDYSLALVAVGDTVNVLDPHLP